MTFCVGVSVPGGLVGLADTQVVKGVEVSSKSKLSLHAHGGHRFFVMTSGLRSVRDKVVLRLEDSLDSLGTPMRACTRSRTAFGDELRNVRAEDGPSLGQAGLRFNLHAIIGGQLANDDQPVLLLIYPAGNWVIATEDSPSFIIGRSAYGKPILDRLLTPATTMTHAIALAYLAFDATRASVIDVDFPIDVVVVTSDGELRQHRFSPEDLTTTHDSWQQHLQNAVSALPMEWAAGLLPGHEARP